MKIAVASDDGVNIARHFGRSKTYIVFETCDGGIASTSLVPPAGAPAAETTAREASTGTTTTRLTIMAPWWNR